jgi:5'(3')-deoxyribonucleotidase
MFQMIFQRRKTMIVAFDLDEVLANTLQAFLTFYNAAHGTHASVEKCFSSDWAEYLCLSQSAITAIIRDFTLSECGATIAPVPGAVEAVRELSAIGELHIVTSRWGALVDITPAWIERHFPNQFAAVHYSKTSHSVPLNESGQSKAAICKAIGAEVIIEDCSRHSLDCLSHGVNVLLMDRPWNRDFEDSRILRVRSWSGVPEMIARNQCRPASEESDGDCGKNISSVVSNGRVRR